MFGAILSSGPLHPLQLGHQMVPWMVVSLGNPDLDPSIMGVVEGDGVLWVVSQVLPTLLYKPFTGLTHFPLHIDETCAW